MKKFIILFCFILIFPLYAQNLCLEYLLSFSTMWNSILLEKNQIEDEDFQNQNTNNLSKEYSKNLYSALATYLEESLENIKNIDEQLYTEALLYFELIFYTSYIRDNYLEADFELDQMITKVFENELKPANMIHNKYVFLFYPLFNQLQKKLQSSFSSHLIDSLDDYILEKTFDILPSFQFLQEKNIQEKRYYVLSTIENIFLKYLDYRFLQDERSFQLSEDLFYSLINSPSLLYYLFHKDRYFPLRDAFLLSAEKILSLDESVLKELKNPSFDFLYEADFNFLPKNFYLQLYKKLDEKKQKKEIAIIYQTQDLILNLFEISARHGFSFFSLLTNQNQILYNAFLEDSFNLSLCDYALLESFKANIDFIYLTNVLFYTPVQSLLYLQMMEP